MCTALVLGWLSVGLSPFAPSTHVGSVTLSLDIALVFAALASLAHGVRGALVAWSFGMVAAIPFVLWPNNGYGCVASSVALLLWMLGLAYGAQQHRRTPRWWNHPLLVQLPLGILYVAMARFVYPLVLPLNPAPFCKSCVSSMPSTLLWSIGLKSFFQLYFAVLGAQVSLRSNAVRRLLRLPLRAKGAHNGWIIVTTLLLAVVLWASTILLTTVLQGATRPLPWWGREPELAEMVQLGVFVVGGLVAAYAVINLVEGLRHSAEKAAKALNAQLSMQLELEQARKMEALGQLAGGVAHDFNNMLAGIFSSVEVLEHELPKHGEARESLETIATAAHAAKGLTKQLLSASQRRAAEIGPVNVHDAIEAAIPLLRRSLSEVVELSTNLKAVHPFVSLDVTQLQSALINLAVNSGHAMPQGGVLYIATRDALVDGEPQLQLIVRDSGMGIPDEHLPHIFDPFFTTRNGKGGTGLGLASVRAFCEKTGGTVSVESRSDAGTTFLLSLPVARPSQAKIAIVHNPTPLREERQTALVVDDDDLARRGAARQLRMLGFATLEAHSGTEAIDIYRMHGPSIDVVLMDVQMPGMSGLECLQHLLSLDPEVRVLFCSGYVGSEVLQQELAISGCPLLDKPFRRHELQAAIAGLEHVRVDQHEALETIPQSGRRLHRV